MWAGVEALMWPTVSKQVPTSVPKLETSPTAVASPQPMGAKTPVPLSPGVCDSPIEQARWSMSFVPA